jgi:predicted CXXCH cytochrome family protein
MMAGGAVLLVLGLLMLPTPSGIVVAQDFSDAEYIGRGECNDCHRAADRAHRDSPHVLALQDVTEAEAKATILGDFSQGDVVRTVLFPGESDPRPFTADDIAYAMGSGRYVQRYVVETGDGEYTVLPVEWNTAAQTWEPFQLAESWPDPAYDFVSQCAGCHTTGLEANRGRWEDDGVECEACHGPGSTHADLVDDAGSTIDDEEVADIRATSAFTSDAQICGQCHSRGATPAGSPYPTDYLPGQNLLDDSVFTLAAQDDPVHWWASGHASQSNMQFNEWALSAHATSLDDMKGSDKAQDGCLQCHSDDLRRTTVLLDLFDNGDLESDAEIPPELATLETAQSGVTCTACHAPHSDEPRDFLLRDDAETLCAACHSNAAYAALTDGGVHHPVVDMFKGLPLVPGVEGVPARHETAENGPTCATCHLAQVPVAGGTLRSNHLFRPVLPGTSDGQPDSSCSTCHTDLTQTDLQYLVDDTQEAVRSRIATTLARLASVKEPEAGTPEHDLYDLAVNVLNVVQAEGSLGIHNYAYTDTLFKAAEQALGELSVSAVVVEPTEAPAPTAIPAVKESALEATPHVVTSGARPMTVIVIGVVVVILLTAAFAFFRRPRSSKEARTR